MPAVAIVTNLYPPHILGGYEILCRQVSVELATRGWDIRVLTSRHGLVAGDKSVERIDGIEVSRLLNLYLPFDQPPTIDRAHRYRVTKQNEDISKEWFSDSPPDIVFFWSQLRSTLGPLRAAESMGLPSAITINDSNIASYSPAPWTRPHKAIQDHVLRSSACLRRSDLKTVTCISEVVREDLSTKLGYDVPATVIHQGVPTEELPPKASPGTTHTPFRVLYAGQLHAYKGVHDLITAAKTLGDRIELRVAGGGEDAYIEDLKAQAASSNTKFLGRLARPDLVQEYQWADVLVFPSVWKEPFGLTHLEAMSCGTPVISTANGGQGEFLVHERNALVVEPEHPEQIVSSIERLIADDNLRARLAQEGIRLTRNEYSLRRYVDDLEAWLQAAVLGE